MSKHTAGKPPLHRKHLKKDSPCSRNWTLAPGVIVSAYPTAPSHSCHYAFPLGLLRRLWTWAEFKYTVDFRILDFDSICMEKASCFNHLFLKKRGFDFSSHCTESSNFSKPYFRIAHPKRLQDVKYDSWDTGTHATSDQQKKSDFETEIEKSSASTAGLKGRCSSPTGHHIESKVPCAHAWRPSETCTQRSSTGSPATRLASKQSTWPAAMPFPLQSCLHDLLPGAA